MRHELRGFARGGNEHTHALFASRKGQAVPIIHECSEPGCNVLTMGDYCVEHEQERRAAPARSTSAACSLQDGVAVEARATAGAT